MRVIPLTSLLSLKGRGCRSPNLDDTLNPDVKELFKTPLRVDLANRSVWPEGIAPKAIDKKGPGENKRPDGRRD